MIPHFDKLSDILSSLGTDAKTGLSDSEAKERLGQYGKNVLREKKRKSNFQRFLLQFKDVMIIILIIAAIISFGIALHEKEGFFEPLLIMLIVILNAVIGVMQENKAEKALDALKTLSSPHSRIIRNGKESIIEASLLVPGDIIILEAGDINPADARIIESSNLKSDESALTGESLAAEKDSEATVASDSPLGDRFNMLYAGCSITYGSAKAVVTETGMKTEMGKIANLLENADDNKTTPLQLKLAQLGKYLGIGALAACGVIFGIGILDKMAILDMFMISVSLAVSAIPEGLPAIVTIVLAIGVQRMAKHNAIVRQLPAVETLGSASVICSDKTGTLTQNRMTLTKAYDSKSNALEDISSENSESIRTLLSYATLCCDGKVEFVDGKESHMGDPTEISIIVGAHKNGIDQDELTERCPRLAAIPFDSDRKLMTTVNSIDGKNIVIVKGAFDMLCERCTSGDIENARSQVDTLSAKALRLLAVAYKQIDKVPAKVTSEELESGLTFMGLVGMIDPPRKEAAEAVKLCKQAGIKVVMITGDHVITAGAIAKELGILNADEKSITGKELEQMSDKELKKQVRSISVYARVTPSDKIRIVRAWQEKGEVVAMTGDGVNDAPALKAADIGCAMGITGTDVAKGAAAMTLSDDNFATIVEAVKEGRGIYDNIKKVVSYLLSTNIGEVLTVFLAMLFWKQTPLLAMQLLWINLITDSLPAIALGMEPIGSKVMDRKPKPKTESLFVGGLTLQVILQGTMFAILTLIAFTIGWKENGDLQEGRTMAFMVLSSLQLVHSFNMRSALSLFKIGPFTNKSLNKAILASVLMLFLVLFIPPVTSIFGLSLLSGKLYGLAALLAFVPIPVLELAKKLGLIKYMD
ncbi:calcium-translocating P-type ATPase, PMCA-type [uncultured Sphaerochaeta sp.]|uniref:calcium-translocating P-type ATPase, PMCA-type n=1 Tax=uncultured Sphaerochaeta sp. TaxID=886478 RepID=UPI002A0A6ED3|nr:calcium-translocating P-type ATPase, PMCA-type [uncultured Sphaerochaeta sp.]